MTGHEPLLAGLDINDLLTVVGTALSAIIFPWISKREEKLRAEADKRYDDLAEQNKMLQSQLNTVIDKLLTNQINKN